MTWEKNKQNEIADLVINRKNTEAQARIKEYAIEKAKNAQPVFKSSYATTGDTGFASFLKAQEGNKNIKRCWC